jgi:hypothetical protein
MNKIYILALTLLSTGAFAQIEQDINKLGGNVESNQINDIDSIRFNSGTAQMEVILNNGNVENHALSDIDNVTFSGSAGPYPPGYVHCGTPTEVVEVTNPNTGEIWMDRNLGASNVATSSTDANAYGDLFQWGRFADGHQCRNSTTITTTSSSDDPGSGDFIQAGGGAMDWRVPQNDNLWQGVNGINNPCPIGFRIPTEVELNLERLTWNGNNNAGAFFSPLILPVAGLRQHNTGSLSQVGSLGLYWSSTVNGTESSTLGFDGSNAGTDTFMRAGGASVRCIKD